MPIRTEESLEFSVIIVIAVILVDGQKVKLPQLVPVPIGTLKSINYELIHV